jgi:hypothetical protein
MLLFNTIPFIGPIIGGILIVIFLLVSYIGAGDHATNLLLFTGVHLSDLTVIIVGAIGIFTVQTLESVW